jgi:hypothetical protein
MSVKPKNIKYIVARYVCAVICVYVPPTFVVRPNLRSIVELNCTRFWFWSDRIRKFTDGCYINC